MVDKAIISENIIIIKINLVWRKWIKWKGINTICRNGIYMEVVVISKISPIQGLKWQMATITKVEIVGLLPISIHRDQMIDMDRDHHQEWHMVGTMIIREMLPISNNTFLPKWVQIMHRDHTSQINHMVTSKWWIHILQVVWDHLHMGSLLVIHSQWLLAARWMYNLIVNLNHIKCKTRQKILITKIYIEQIMENTFNMEENKIRRHKKCSTNILRVVSTHRTTIMINNLTLHIICLIKVLIHSILKVLIHNIISLKIHHSLSNPLDPVKILVTKLRKRLREIVWNHCKK